MLRGGAQPTEFDADGRMTTRSLRHAGRPARFQPAKVLPLTPGVEPGTIEERTPFRAIKRRESTYRRLLALADVGSAALAMLVALSVLGSDQLQPAALLALPLVVVVAKLKGLYDRDAVLLNKTTLDEAPQLFALSTLYALIVSLADQQLVSGNLSHRQTIGMWLLLFATAIVFRTGARWMARRCTGVERVLVVGTQADAARIATKFAEGSAINGTVVGRIPLEVHDSGHRKDVLATRLDELETVVARHDIHRVIVAPQGTSSETMLEAIRAAKGLGIQVSVLPRLLEVIGSSVEFDHLNGTTVMGVRRFGLSRSSAVIKRTLDATGALAGLMVLAPLMAVIALAVKLTSAGPVLFRQKRIGRDGQPFSIVKFRTMVADADEQKHVLRGLNEAAEGLFKIAEDPRMTRLGRFLRRTALDELPQLLNVLRGEMSLVGPRPLVEEEDVRIEGRHRRRLQLKPGMTGQWQIFGASRIPLREMVTIDYLYVANWSLWGDVKILCRTVPYVLARRGL
jgi:exopolysaccharide biosynthesis polyprenyl glycosylphosphotransferase